ncbi:MAG: hypothetical protein MJ252_14895 [archaeon]|nr:hypothetical protein [archaeon]
MKTEDKKESQPQTQNQPQDPNQPEGEPVPEISYAEKYPKYKYYEFPDGSMYYGEVAQINKVGKIITNLEEITNEEEKASIQIVRHGYGIMLCGVKKNEEGVPVSYESKYEGRWSKDRKKGKGKVSYADGSKFEGMFKGDLFNGEGKFVSSQGYKYTGDFADGKFDGNGTFIHSDGHKLEGVFKNGYFYCKENKCFIYPYLSKEEVDSFKMRVIDYENKKGNKFEKFSRENLIKVNTQNDIMKAIDDTLSKNKIPLLLRGNSKNIPKEEIFALFGENYKEIDLRYFYIKLHKSSLYFNPEAYDEMRQIVTEAMTKGLYLILNFDDCKENYTFPFDPDIREFYGLMMLSPYMWNPSMFKDKCASAHLNNRRDLKMDKNFKLVCYSKMIIDESTQEHDLLNLIEKRFEKCFPLANMNALCFMEKKTIGDKK